MADEIIGRISVGDGATFTPSVNSAGELSWTNNKNLPNPATVDIAQAVVDAGSLDSRYLQLSGGTVTGNLTVSGTLTGTASGNLPLSGGTMTGTIDTSYSQALRKTDNNNYIQINSGIATADGSNLVMCAKGYSGGLGAGAFQLTARDSNEYKILHGKPDGTLTWNGKSVQTSDTILFEQYTVSYTLAGNGSEQKSVSVAKTGYTPLGIVGVYPTSSAVAIQSFNISSSTAYVKLKNLTPTAITSTNMYVNVLYVKV